MTYELRKEPAAGKPWALYRITLDGCRSRLGSYTKRSKAERTGRILAGPCGCLVVILGGR